MVLAAFGVKDVGVAASVVAVIAAFIVIVISEVAVGHVNG